MPIRLTGETVKDMARSVFKEAVVTPTLWQRVAGNMVAGRLIRSGNPPLTPEKVGFYVGALEGRRPNPAGAPVLRALIWADIRSRQFRRACLPWYPMAATRFPEDERCAFYVAGLVFHGLIPVEDSEREEAYVRILRPEWKASPYWAKLELPRLDLLRYMVRIIVDGGDPASLSAERQSVLESAMESNALQGEAHQQVVRFVAASYRAANRQDAQAESIYRYLFVHVPDDHENNQFLAELFLSRQSHDANTCVIYTRMVSSAEARGDAGAAGFWGLHLARTYVAIDRIGPEVLPVLLRGLKTAPGERALEAAVVYSIAQMPVGAIQPELQEYLERAFSADGDVMPHFQARRWDWALVVRTLANLWGPQRRRDAHAATLFALSTELFPDERAFWGYRAAAMAAGGDTSMAALDVYERARIHRLADDDTLEALGRAYHRNRLHESPQDIKRVIGVWEQLHEMGRLPVEAQSALASYFLAQERLNDTALAMVSLMATENPGGGELALRLAREFMSRRDALAANRWYQEAIRLQPENVDVLFEYGSLLRSQDERLDALKILARASGLPEAAKNLPVHFALGEVLLELGRRDDAWRVFRTIVEKIDKKHTPTLLHLARLAPADDNSGGGFLSGLNLDGAPPSAAPSEAPRREEPVDPELERIPWGATSELSDAPRLRLEAEDAPARATPPLATLERLLTQGRLDPADLDLVVEGHVARRNFAKAERALDTALEVGLADAARVAALRRTIAGARRRRAA